MKLREISAQKLGNIDLNSDVVSTGRGVSLLPRLLKNVSIKNSKTRNKEMCSSHLSNDSEASFVPSRNRDKQISRLVKAVSLSKHYTVTANRADDVRIQEQPHDSGVSTEELESTMTPKNAI